MAEDVDICDQQSAATSCLGWVAVLALSFITFCAFVTALPLVTTFLMYKWHKMKTARESAKGVNDSEALLPTSVQEAESYGLSDCEDQEHNNLSEEDAANNQSAPQQIHDKPMGHNCAGESSGLWPMASSLSRAAGGQSGSVSVSADPAASCGGEPQPPEATRTCQRQESSNGDLSDESPDSWVFYTANSYIIETPEYTRAMLHQTHAEEEWRDLHSPTKMWGQQESLSQKDQERRVPLSPDETEQNSSDTFHQHQEFSGIHVNVLKDLLKRVESLEKKLLCCQKTELQQQAVCVQPLMTIRTHAAGRRERSWTEKLKKFLMTKCPKTRRILEK